MPQELKPELLIRYHLGELSPPERDEIEERYFSDEDFHDQVLAAEDELIDSYLHGELASEQKEHFESRFLQIDNRRKKLAFARSLTDDVQRRVAINDFISAFTADPRTEEFDRLAQYHLGELSSEERDKVEARFFVDEDFHDQVLAAEEELIDSYVHGELTTEQREHFENWFLQLHNRRKQLIFARALSSVVQRRYPPELEQYRPAYQIEHSKMERDILGQFFFDAKEAGFRSKKTRESAEDIALAREMRLKSLARIKAIDIKIDSIALGPFRTAQLAADVEGRIRNTAVLSLTNDAPDATLCVDVDVQLKSGSSIFEIQVFMFQLVTIDRTGDKTVAITWGPMTYLGMDSKIEEAFDTISKNVGDYVDLFLSDYLTANPKRK